MKYISKNKRNPEVNNNIARLYIDRAESRGIIMMTIKEINTNGVHMQVGRGYHVTTDTASALANKLGVGFTKCGPFKKWISAEAGVRKGSYAYTPAFKFGDDIVSLCYCKFNGEQSGVVGMIKVKNMDLDQVIVSNRMYAHIADYLV